MKLFFGVTNSNRFVYSSFALIWLRFGTFTCFTIFNGAKSLFLACIVIISEVFALYF